MNTKGCSGTGSSVVYTFPMKNNVLIGVGALIIVLGGAYFLLQPQSVPAPAIEQEVVIAATTTPEAPQKIETKKSEPTFSVGPTTKTVVSVKAAFDSSTITTPDSYPTITGTANVPEVGIIINNSKGEGLVGTGEITVENGHWSYSSSIFLPPGTYTIALYGGAKVVNAQLTITP